MRSGATIFTAVAIVSLGYAERDASERTAQTGLIAMAEAWDNTRGGVATGGSWNTFVELSAEVDGRRFGMPADGRFAGQLRWVANRGGHNGFGAKIGASNQVSNILAEDHLRVFNLNYRQTAADRSWEFKIGQLAADDDFMVSEYAAVFLDSAFGAMPSEVATPLSSRHDARTAFAIFDVAAPGACIQFRRSDALCWQAGVYHGGPGPDSRGNHGFDWESGDVGVAIFSELVARHRVGGREVTSRLGMSEHTGEFDELPAFRQGRVAYVHGLFGAYTVQEIVLAADADAKPRFGAFCRFGVSPQQDRTAVSEYGDTGVVWFGPFHRSHDDALGFAVSVTHFARDFRALHELAATETAVELTWRTALNRWFSVQLDAQLLANPAPRPGAAARETAMAMGLRTIARF